MRHSIVVISAALLAIGCTSGPPDTVQSHFDFTTNAFAFANYDDTVSGGELTPALAERMLGTQAVCASGDGETCTPTPVAQQWLEEVNQTLQHGHSEGFAVLSLLMAMGKVEPATFGAANAAELERTNRALQAELAYWAATQKIPSVHARDQKLQPKDVLAFLAKALPDSAEGWRLLIAIKDETGFRAGHAVVPFGYFKGDQPGQYFLRLYDSNFPGSERRLELNVEANTWRYEGSPDADRPRTYTGGADNPLFFSPVTDRLGTLVPTFTDGFGVSTTAGVLLVESETASVGFKNGQLVENGGSVFPGAADCFCKPPNSITNVVVAGAGAKTITVGGDAGTVYATSPSVSAVVNSASGGTGGLTVDPSSKTVTYNSTSDAGTVITTTTKNADGSQTTVTVTVDKATRSVTVDASDPTNVKVKADATDNGTKVAVTMTVTQPDGASKTVYAEGKTRGDNDAQIAFTSVDGGTQAMVNTSVNYATCLNGVKDPLEGDLDCGAYCAMQTERRGDGLCRTQSACGSDGDCSPEVGADAGNCFNGTCSRALCNDGRMNGAETSVDCGGGCPCPAGLGCASQVDCRVGLQCFARVCQVPKVGRLTITGLAADGFVRLFYDHDGLPQQFVDVRGATDGADLTQRFNAVDTLQVRASPDSHFSCAFDQAGNAQGDWLWSASQTPTLAPNTLRCRRARVDVAYTTSGSGCPAEIEYVFFDAGTRAPIRAWERLPEAPLLTVASATAGVLLAPGATSTTVRKTTTPVLWQSLSLTADAGYDGGTAYQVSVQGTVTSQSSYRYSTLNTALQNSLGLSPNTYQQTCTFTGSSSGPFGNGQVLVPLSCSCVKLTDGGSVVVDAGAPDAGPPDAGPVDAGSVDAGPMRCTTDSECPSADCYCAGNSGNCASRSGTCGAAKFVTRVPTVDGVMPSATFTVPAGCSQVLVEAWGAVGGQGMPMGIPLPFFGGAGGFVTGTLSVSFGDVFTAWVGQNGALATDNGSNQGQGSYLGTPARGGLSNGQLNFGSGGSGAGLTSLKLVSLGGTQLHALSVPGGAGAGAQGEGPNAGSLGSGDNTSKSGGNAAASSKAGGGGAGENGGTAGLNNGSPGVAGAFGALPSGFTSEVGPSPGVPGGATLNDHTGLCASAGATMGSAAGGCVVLRCLP